MHPAGSLIAFTTLSGLGLGLLFWLGIDPTPPTGWIAVAFFGLGFVLAGAGLSASALHLGRPERALKAFTQWRTSWLSREAWLAAGAMGLMGLHALGLSIFGQSWQPLGWIGAVLCLGTVAATAMIYAQLKTVPRWRHWSTPALFLLLALTGGALLAGRIPVALPLLVAAGIGQLLWWRAGDGRFATSGTTLASATGLGGSGQVRAFEPPHTGGNYLTREMVHVVGRRHATRLRVIALVLMAGLPVLLLLLPAGHLTAGLAVISHAVGVAVSRWLFFAQAEHVVGLYYGRR